MVLRLPEVCSELVSHLRAEIFSVLKKIMSQYQKTLNLPPIRLPSVPMTRFPTSRWIPQSLLKVRCFFFFSLRMKMEVNFSNCEELGLWVLEASFVSLTTEWFPYNMTRKHLPNTSLYGDQKWSICWSFKNSAFWTSASGTVLEPRHIREHLLSRAGLHPSMYPTFLVENCSNCHGSGKLRYEFLLPSFITVPTTGTSFK